MVEYKLVFEDEDEAWQFAHTIIRAGNICAKECVKFLNSASKERRKKNKTDADKASIETLEHYSNVWAIAANVARKAEDQMLVQLEGPGKTEANLKIYEEQLDRANKIKTGYEKIKNVSWMN